MFDIDEGHFGVTELAGLVSLAYLQKNSSTKWLQYYQYKT